MAGASRVRARAPAGRRSFRERTPQSFLPTPTTSGTSSTRRTHRAEAAAGSRRLRRAPARPGDALLGLAEIPRELRARRRSGSYHGPLAEPCREPGGGGAEADVAAIGRAGRRAGRQSAARLDQPARRREAQGVTVRRRSRLPRRTLPAPSTRARPSLSCSAGATTSRSSSPTAPPTAPTRASRARGGSPDALHGAADGARAARPRDCGGGRRDVAALDPVLGRVARLGRARPGRARAPAAPGHRRIGRAAPSGVPCRWPTRILTSTSTDFHAADNQGRDRIVPGSNKVQEAGAVRRR